MLLSKHLTKAFYIIKDEGLISFFRWIIRWAFSNVLSLKSLIIFELDLNGSIPEIIPKINLTFRFATREDIVSLDAVKYDYDTDGIHYCLGRMEKGDKCLLALHKGKIIGYLWLMNGEMELSMAKIMRLPENKSYIYKVFVLDEFRGKRVYAGMHQKIMADLKKAGKKWLITTGERNNLSAIKATQRMGFREKGNLIRILCLGFSFNYISKRDLLYLRRQ
jgi:predicted GNAT family acetyltransferase